MKKVQLSDLKHAAIFRHECWWFSELFKKIYQHFAIVVVIIAETWLTWPIFVRNFTNDPENAAKCRKSEENHDFLKDELDLS